MRKIVTRARAQVVLVALVALVGATAAFPCRALAAEWKEFASDEGGFAVVLPDEPKVEAATTPTDLGPVEMHTVKTVTDTMLCSVTYYDVRLDAKRPAGAFLEGTCQDFVRGANLLQKGDVRAVALGENPGREVVGETADGRAQLTARYYLVGKRVFLVLVATSVDDAASTDVARFLDSFRLLDRPAAHQTGG
jgi:hypothetical protein